MLSKNGEDYGKDTDFLVLGRHFIRLIELFDEGNGNWGLLEKVEEKGDGPVGNRRAEDEGKIVDIERRGIRHFGKCGLGV